MGADVIPIVYDVIGFRRGPFLGIVLAGRTFASDQSDVMKLAELMLTKIEREIEELSR
jgi:hypothetical protein